MSRHPRPDVQSARSELMAADELQEIITRACTGRHINAYRCPFGDGTRANAHWHIGHVPSVASLERLAVAVRQHAQGAA